MTMLLLLMLTAVDERFPSSTQKEFHLFPSAFKPLGAPLDEKLFPGGPWYPAVKVKLSKEYTGYVVFSVAKVVQLFVYDQGRRQMNS